LERIVRRMGFGFTISFLSSETCRFRRAGYIIKKRQMPMGTEMPPICQLSMARLSAGKNWDRASPTSMQRPTQTARYLSKTPRALPPSELSAILNLRLSDIMAKIVYRRKCHNRSILCPSAASHPSYYKFPLSLKIR